MNRRLTSSINHSRLPRIFLDTSTLKAARDSDLVFVPRKQKLNWGGKTTWAVIHDLAYENRNTKLLQTNKTAFDNRLHNRLIGRLAKDNFIELLVSNEVIFEAMRVPGVDASFYKSPITTVKSPIAHSGLVIAGDGRDHLYEALRNVSHQRFTQLQKLTGAYQGEDRKLNRNQLLDAFHLWTAELSDADFLLTHDEKLVRMWSASRYQGRCRPIDTVPLINELLAHRFRLVWPILREAWSIRRSKRNLTMRYQPYTEVDEDFQD